MSLRRGTKERPIMTSCRAKTEQSKMINTKRDISQQVLSLMAPFLLQSTLKKAMKTTIMYDGGALTIALAKKGGQEVLAGNQETRKRHFSASSWPNDTILFMQYTQQEQCTQQTCLLGWKSHCYSRRGG